MKKGEENNKIDFNIMKENEAMKSNEVDESRLTETVNIQYWTGLCGFGRETRGGTVQVSVTPEEKTMIESAKDMKDSEFTDFLVEKLPAVMELIHKEAVSEMEMKMADHFVNSLCVYHKRFEGWSYDEMFEYELSTTKGLIDEICDFSYEFAKE